MAINTIEKYHLETRAYDLKTAGKSYAEIAETLSETTNKKITKSSVYRFFDTHDNIREEIIQDIIERNDTIIAKSIIQAFDISAFRIRLTSSLMELLDTKLKEPYKDGKEIAALAKEIREGLNDMDQILPALSPGTIENDLGVTLTDAELLKAIEITEPGSQ